MAPKTSASDFDTKFVLAYCFTERQHQVDFGFCYFDLSTLRVYTGSFEDDFTLKKFRTLVLQIRPVEVVCLTSVDKKHQTLGILMNCAVPPCLSQLSRQTIGFTRAETTQVLEQKLQKFFPNKDSPEFLETCRKKISDLQQESMVSALLIAVCYLESLMLAETTLPVCEFFKINSLEDAKKSLQKTHMVIDAQAIEHLELLEIPGKSRNIQEGTLLSYLTKHNNSAFGKRLMKKWLVHPLRDVDRINTRLDAVEDLKEHSELRSSMARLLSGLPDLERMVSKIYTYSVKQSVAAIYIDMQAKRRLDEFYDLLATFKKVES